MEWDFLAHINPYTGFVLGVLGLMWSMCISFVTMFFNTPKMKAEVSKIEADKYKTDIESLRMIIDDLREHINDLKSKIDGLQMQLELEIARNERIHKLEDCLRAAHMSLP